MSLTSISADIFFAVSMDDIAQPCLTAQESQENLPLPSVAVVMTGKADILSAKNRARSLAPPMCPERIGITYLP